MAQTDLTRDQDASCVLMRFQSAVCIEPRSSRLALLDAATPLDFSENGYATSFFLTRLCRDAGIGVKVAQEPAHFVGISRTSHWRQTLPDAPPVGFRNQPRVANH